jgi:hypothetical protein
MAHQAVMAELAEPEAQVEQAVGTAKAAQAAREDLSARYLQEAWLDTALPQPCSLQPYIPLLILMLPAVPAARAVTV